MANCLWFTVYYLLSTLYCLLLTVNFILLTVDCLLFTAYWIHFAVYCSLFVAYCLLLTVYCIVFIAYFFPIWLFFINVCRLILTVYCLLYNVLITVPNYLHNYNPISQECTLKSDAPISKIFPWQSVSNICPPLSECRAGASLGFGQSPLVPAAAEALTLTLTQGKRRWREHDNCLDLRLYNQIWDVPQYMGCATRHGMYNKTWAVPQGMGC